MARSPPPCSLVPSSRRSKNPAPKPKRNQCASIPLSKTTKTTSMIFPLLRIGWTTVVYFGRTCVGRHHNDNHPKSHWLPSNIHRASHRTKRVERFLYTAVQLMLSYWKLEFKKATPKRRLVVCGSEDVLVMMNDMMRLDTTGIA